MTDSYGRREGVEDSREVRPFRADGGGPAESLLDDLDDLRLDLLDAAASADEGGVPLIARNLELWSYSIAQFLADLEPGRDPRDVGTIIGYLDGVEGYERPDRDRDGLDDHGETPL